MGKLVSKTSLPRSLTVFKLSANIFQTANPVYSWLAIRTELGAVFPLSPGEMSSGHAEEQGLWLKIREHCKDFEGRRHSLKAKVQTRDVPVD